MAADEKAEPHSDRHITQRGLSQLQAVIQQQLIHGESVGLGMRNEKQMVLEQPSS